MQEEEEARKEKKELDERLKAEEKARREAEQAALYAEESQARSLLPEAEVRCSAPLFIDWSSSKLTSNLFKSFLRRKTPRSPSRTLE